MKFTEEKQSPHQKDQNPSTETKTQKRNSAKDPTLAELELERLPTISARIELGPIEQSPRVMNCKPNKKPLKKKKQKPTHLTKIHTQKKKNQKEKKKPNIR